MYRTAWLSMAAALLASQAPAAREVPYAKLVEVSGNVLVSTEANIASASDNLRLSPGMRVLVTFNSGATVEYGDGCRVRLAAGERFDVKAERPCAPRGGRPGATYAPVIAGRP